MLVVLGCTVVAGAVVFLSRGPHQPEYEGRRLSQWIDRLALRSPPASPEAEEAIRHIGTNALPWLVKWSLYDVPWPRRMIYRFSSRLPRRVLGVDLGKPQ